MKEILKFFGILKKVNRRYSNGNKFRNNKEQNK